MFEIAAICLSITAFLAYLNHRFIGLPNGIGVMAAALVLSLALVGLDRLGVAPTWHAYQVALVHSIDFSEVLMQGMLSVLLFAGALHVDLSALRAQRWTVGLLAVFGTTLSTAVVGVAMYYALPLLGLPLPLLYCLLFGALIAPTDPIAVMGILKSARAPKELELVIAGESLFNDGVGVVVFVLLLGMLSSGVTPSPGQAAALLAQEAGGGLLYGALLGAATFYLLRSVESYAVEALITLAVVTGGYALASRLHVSGPLAMVVVGLWVGNPGRTLAMSELTRGHLDVFWELLDEILNAVLFVLIGLEIVRVPLQAGQGLAILLAIAVTLGARALIVGAPIGALSERLALPRGSWMVLTWGGLRGGISVALALSLPAGSARDLVVAITYGVVLFSILAQGLSIGEVTRRSLHRD